MNNLRLDWSTTEELDRTHRKVAPLLETLTRLNNRQGLGYKVFGKVVDKRTLNIIFVSATSFFLTVMPVLIALMPPAEEDTQRHVHDRVTLCNFTASELEVAEVARLLLRSCPSNATVTDVVAL